MLDAKIWIVKNQLGRRNLSDYDRGKLGLELAKDIEAKAKEKQREHGGTAPGKTKSLPQKSDEVSIDTREIEKLPQKSAKAIDTREMVAETTGLRLQYRENPYPSALCSP